MKAHLIPALFILLSCGGNAVSTGDSGPLEDPVIDPIVNSEGLAHGQEFTITGAGFGEKPSAPPKLWDTVENQPSYGSLDDGDPVPIGEGHPWKIQSQQMDFLHDYPVRFNSIRPGRGSSEAHYFAGTRGFLRGWDMGENGEPRFYMSWWIKFNREVTDQRTPEGTIGGKLVRIWDSDGDHGRSSLSPSGAQVSSNEDGGIPSETAWGDWSGITNEWNHVEVIIDSEAAIYKAVVNGKTIHHVVGFDLVGYSLNCPFMVGFECSLPVGCPSPGEFEIDMDDFYIDTSWAHVEICDVEALDEAEYKHCEVQPATAWSPSSITFTANKGSFESDTTYYLFVVSPSGIRSPGQPIRFR